LIGYFLEGLVQSKFVLYEKGVHFNVLWGEFRVQDTMWAIVEASFNSGNYRWEYHFTVASGEDGLTKEHIGAVERIARRHGLNYDYVIVADEKRRVYVYNIHFPRVAFLAW
jgi:hypothetical protein